MRATLHLIARVYAVEDRAQGLTPGGKIGLRQRLSAPLLAREVAQVSARPARAGPAEESVGSRGALRAEPVGGTDAFP